MYDESLFRNHGMQPAKEVFSKESEKLIDAFGDFCREFIKVFEETGPGSPGVKLDEGFIQMQVSSLMYRRPDYFYEIFIFL